MRDMNDTQSSQAKEIKVTRNTRIVVDGDTLRIDKAWHHESKGGIRTCWEITNQNEKATDHYDTLGEAMEAMSSYIGQGGRVVA